MPASAFFRPSFTSDKEPMEKRQSSGSFESYAPIINCLERKIMEQHDATIHFTLRSFLSIAFRMVSNLRIQSTSATFGFSGC